MAQKKLGLSMRGGGAKCGGYLGVIKAIEEAKIQIDMMIGSSMGGMIAVLYASGYSVDEIIEISKRFSPAKLLSFESIKNKTLFGHEHVKRIINEFVNVRTFEDLGKPVFLQVTNLVTKKSEIISSGSLLEPLIATMAYPFVLPPVEINGQLYADGDISSGYEVKFLKNKGAEYVIGLNSGDGPESSAYKDDFYHRFLVPVSIAYCKIQDLDVQIDPPEMIIGDIGTGIEFLDFDSVEVNANKGYKEAKKHIKQIAKDVEGKSISSFWKKIFA